MESDKEDNILILFLCLSCLFEIILVYLPTIFTSNECKPERDIRKAYKD